MEFTFSTQRGYSICSILGFGASTWISVLSWLLAFSELGLPSAAAQSDANSKPASPNVVTFTTKEDHEQMLRQLGIVKLRPGPSGNESAPNHANYDESLANPFPRLPELLKRKDGSPVTNAEEWRKRRAEIVEDFEREVYGRVPANVPAVKWSVESTRETTQFGVEVVEKRLVGTVDNSACPAIEVKLAATLLTPKSAHGPVPALIMFGFGGPPPGGRGAGATGPKPAPTGESKPSADGKPNTEAKPNSAPKPAPRGPGGGTSRTETLLKAGWAVVTLSTPSIQADNGAGLTRGIIGLTNRGQPRKPDDWGSLRAWGWGASRVLDYLETDASVDAKRVGVEGVSRYGKAALVAMAFDERFAAALVGSSGAGGAKLHRRNFGEAVENLTGSGEYHWMAGNYLKYGAAESSFGSKNAGDLPVDSHQLIALCAPRLTFISYGIPEKGDAKWLDQRGSFMAAVEAGAAFRLLGAKDLGVAGDFSRQDLPPVNYGLVDGHLAWRQHDGGHTDAPNIEHFIRWAEMHWRN